MEKPHCNKHFNIPTAISTDICILLNFTQMFEFLKKTPVAFTHENKHVFSLPLPKKQCQFAKGIKKAMLCLLYTSENTIQCVLQ